MQRCIEVKNFKFASFKKKSLTANSPNQKRKRRMKIQTGSHIIYLANHNMKKNIFYDIWHGMIWYDVPFSSQMSCEWISYTVQYQCLTARQHSICLPSLWRLALGGANSVSRSDDSMLLSVPPLPAQCCVVLGGVEKDDIWVCTHKILLNNNNSNVKKSAGHSYTNTIILP